MRRTLDRSGIGDDDLICRFVATFEQLDDLMCLPSDTAPPELANEVRDGWDRWRPTAIATAREQLEALYRKLPGRFPNLYEQLVLTHRWLEVHLQSVMLLANPPGRTLDGLEREIFRDPVLIATLLPAGLIPFGKVSGGGYDPMCFDLNSQRRGDCQIIQVEHEAVLCHDRLGKTWPRYASFRELVWDTIDLAESKRE
jgi:hypothetical protein